MKQSDEFVKYQMGIGTYTFEFQDFSSFSGTLFKFLFGGKMCYFCFNTCWYYTISKFLFFHPSIRKVITKLVILAANCPRVSTTVLQVVEFSSRGYKIREIFA